MIIRPTPHPCPSTNPGVGPRQQNLYSCSQVWVLLLLGVPEPSKYLLLAAYVMLATTCHQSKHFNPKIDKSEAYYQKRSLFFIPCIKANTFA